MTLSLFDAQLLEKVMIEKFPEKEQFSKTEVIVILNEMTKAEKYYPRGRVTFKGQKYKIFRYFVRYCLYRNLANFDTMLLLTGDKGCFFSDEKIKTSEGNKTCGELGLIDKDFLKVWAYDFKNNVEVLSDAQYFDTGRKKTYELELEDGRKIITTNDHKFFVRRKNKIIEVKLKNILLSDELVTII